MTVTGSLWLYRVYVPLFFAKIASRGSYHMQDRFTWRCDSCVSLSDTDCRFDSLAMVQDKARQSVRKHVSQVTTISVKV